MHAINNKQAPYSRMLVPKQQSRQIGDIQYICVERKGRRLEFEVSAKLSKLDWVVQLRRNHNVDIKRISDNPQSDKETLRLFLLLDHADHSALEDEPDILIEPSDIFPEIMSPQISKSITSAFSSNNQTKS